MRDAKYLEAEYLEAKEKDLRQLFQDKQTLEKMFKLEQQKPID